MNIGEELKKAREALQIDERHVSEATYIRREYIIALEENRFDDIKLKNVYRIGFLRIYSKYLKLDPEVIVAEYKASQGIKPQGKSNARAIAAAEQKKSPAVTDSLIGSELEESAPILGENTAKPNVKKLAIAAGVTVAAMLALVFIGLKACSSGTDEPVATDSSGVQNESELLRRYKFEVLSSADQQVQIYENYDPVKKTRGACIVNEFVQKNKPKIFTGRGILYIKEEVRGGLSLTLPKKSIIDGAPAGTEPVELPLSSTQKDTLNCVSATVWVQGPK